MNFKNYLALTILFSISLISCRKDFEADYATQNLSFSRDTVKLDTVFNQIRSETYSVKVYNNESKDVLIPRIYLEKGVNSFFKINVNGKSGFEFYDIPLKSKDSMYIFVEIAPNINPPATALQDEDIIFKTTNEQRVKLLSLVEDVEFYYPPTGQSSLDITSDLNWTNNKPKLIFGNLTIKNNARLNISSGTKIYFHKKSSLIIDANSQLNILGSLNNEVILRGDRHDPYYDNLPANWQGIYLKQNAIANINYGIIKGGNIAIESDQNANIILKNTKIFNFLESGIFAVGSIISGENLVFNQVGNYALDLNYGGNYNFKHCTFANYLDDGIPGLGKTLYLSNGFQSAYNNLNAAFSNCIFYGDSKQSIIISKNAAASFSYLFDTNIMRAENIGTNDFNPATDSNVLNSTSLINLDPLFVNTTAAYNQLNLQTNSPAKAKAKSNIAVSIPFDIKNVSRTINPSVGAYQ